MNSETGAPRTSVDNICSYAQARDRTPPRSALMHSLSAQDIALQGGLRREMRFSYNGFIYTRGTEAVVPDDLPNFALGRR
jgi:hypothetical protein